MDGKAKPTDGSRYYVGCDLGANSGRVMLGTLRNGVLALEEIRRFPTGIFPINGALRWNLPRFFEEIRAGFRSVARRRIPIAGISADSWGVDHVHLSRDEPFLSLPYHYRDSRTDGSFDAVFAGVSPDEIYRQTGSHFYPTTTLFQLCADLRDRPEMLRFSECFVGIADSFNFLFSGKKVMEESAASTTQLYDPALRQWAWPLIEALGLPRRIFPRIVPSATVLGGLRGELAAEFGWNSTQVIASCSHDTAAAVAAVPAVTGQWAYLSFGTWALMGIERSTPLIGPGPRKGNFTNEAGLDGTIRFLRRHVGMWIVQEVRRAWEEDGQTFSYDELSCLASQAEPFRSLIDPSSPSFHLPGRMPDKIADYCNRTSQPVPASPGQHVRCIFDSLALLYAAGIEELETVTGHRIERLHVVGGGSKDAVLSQLIADAISRPVVAGPAESSSAGNILVQAMALGDVGSPDELRRIVGRSFTVTEYVPGPRTDFDRIRGRFDSLHGTE